LALRQRRQACRAWVRAVWLGWLELARVNCRSGPKRASIGSAREALVGVKHSSALCFPARVRVVVPLCADRLPQIT